MGAPDPVLVHVPTDLLAKALPQQAHWCLVNFQFNNIFDNAAARPTWAFGTPYHGLMAPGGP